MIMRLCGYIRAAAELLPKREGLPCRGNVVHPDNLHALARGIESRSEAA